MKPWHKIKGQAVKARSALKIEDAFWRWWKEQDALKEKDTAEYLSQAERAILYALMVWSDDGGPAA